MTLIFRWGPNLFSILVSTFWIFGDILLILWARSTKKKESKPKYATTFLVLGIALFVSDIVAIFLPEVDIDFSTFPESSDLLMFTTIIFLYNLIPIILHFLLAVILVLYFYNVSYHYNKKSLVGPLIFLIGHIINVSFLIVSYSILLSIYDFDILEIFEILEMIEKLEILIDVGPIINIIIFSIQSVGFTFVFIYSIYKNNVLLIMFCGLYFANILITLFNIINNALIEFYPW